MDAVCRDKDMEKAVPVGAAFLMDMTRGLAFVLWR